MKYPISVKGGIMIDNLTDEQKSVLLAKAMGWRVHYDPENVLHLKPTGTEQWYRGDAPRISCNLYHPARMALAWRVLNWAWEQKTDDWLWSWILDECCLDGGIPPADAQRLWLDKILEMAIEAGIAEVDNA